jgi:hypothetical protein
VLLAASALRLAAADGASGKNGGGPAGSKHSESREDKDMPGSKHSETHEDKGKVSADAGKAVGRGAVDIITLGSPTPGSPAAGVQPPKTSTTTQY